MNPFSSAVNQKLFLADVIVRQVNPEHPELSQKSNAENVGIGQIGAGHVEMALGQSAIFQLKCAFQLYLNEIANNYKVASDIRIGSIKQLIDALLNADKYPAEATEIQTLLEDKQSWLAGLFRDFDIISEPHSLAVEDKTAIPVQQLGEQRTVGKLTLKQVQWYLTEFRELLERQRGLMIEC